MSNSERPDEPGLPRFAQNEAGSKFQRLIDGLWSRTIIKFIPLEVEPNHITILRIFFIPLVLYYLSVQLYGWALVYFLIASLLDSLDGALARVRNKITALGLVLDPVSDKLLVILTLSFLIFNYPYPWLFVFAVLFDLPLLLGGLLFLFKMKNGLKEVTPANWWGKIKMVLQVLAVLAVFLYLIYRTDWWLAVSAVLLIFSAIFGLLNMVSQGEKILKK